MERDRCDCSTSSCNVSRRQVLLGAAMGAAATLTRGIGAFAGPFEASEFEHLVPADKKLSPEWLASLPARGEPTIYKGQELDLIGMPIGGIGAGQVYLGGDGKLWHWDIFNQHISTGAGNYAKPPAPASPFEQGFAIRVKGERDWLTKSLDRTGFKDISFRGQYPIGRVSYAEKDFPVTVELEAYSPFIPLNTDDSSLPATVLNYMVKNTGAADVEVELAGWLQNAVCLQSGSPGRLARHNRISRSDGMLRLDCTAVAKPQAKSQAPRGDILFEDFEKPTYEGWTVTGTAFGDGPVEIAKIPKYQGDVGGVGKRVVNSHNTRHGKTVGHGDADVGVLLSRPFTIERNYITFLVGGGAHKGKTCVNLLIDGKAVLSVTGKNNNHMTPAQFDTRHLTGKTGQIQIVDNETGPWGNIGVDQIVFSDKSVQKEWPLEEEADFGEMTLALIQPGVGARGVASIGAILPGGAFADAAAGSETASDDGSPLLPGAVVAKQTIKAGQSVTFMFVIAWRFPNLRLDHMETKGRWYAAKFATSADVATYIANNISRLQSDTRLWCDTWYDSTLPYWFLDRTMANASILATSTSFRFGSGRFYGWEGVGCCPGTCGHVWHYAHSAARLFPDLERACREQVDYADGIGFDPKTGAIDFRAEYHNGWAADGQTGTILRAYREHQMSADGAFLGRIWPKVKQSMQFMIEQDSPGKPEEADGILEGPQPNTLDTTWYGPIGWLSSLYLASLRAAEEMAKEMGDLAFADQCHRIFTRGSARLVELCYNGEYFNQKLDPAHPEAMKIGNGCEIDQVFGQSWAHQVGLGRILPKNSTQSALQALWKYNFTPDVGPYRAANKMGRWYAMPGEGGLLMCTWPKGDKIDAQGKAPDWAFGYFNECMSGFEHQVAGHMLWEGMTTEGLAILRAIHDRYHASRRNPWNEVECGDHYARAMASHGVYLAACGFEHHGPMGHIGFSPKIVGQTRHFRAAFTSCEGWGTYEQWTPTAGPLTAHIEVKYGQLRLQTFSSAEFAPKENSAMITIGDRIIPADVALIGGSGAFVILKEAVIIRAGQRLVIHIA